MSQQLQNGQIPMNSLNQGHQNGNHNGNNGNHNGNNGHNGNHNGMNHGHHNGQPGILNSSDPTQHALNQAQAINNGQGAEVAKGEASALLAGQGNIMLNGNGNGSMNAMHANANSLNFTNPGLGNKKVGSSTEDCCCSLM